MTSAGAVRSWVGGFLVGVVALASGLAAGDKKADEEYKKINPPAPYRLHVFASVKKGEGGAETIRKVFAEKDRNKKDRVLYHSWFVLVPTREDAEIVLDINEAALDFQPGFETKSYITGVIAIPGMLEGVPIRGEDFYGRQPIWSFKGPQPQLNLLSRVIGYMRGAHKDAVLAHGGPVARTP